ncbi:large ribosomal subunit protein bL19m-like [Lineus longissimus]|uniref:large ribosomal subunit protein bL19m-like n=1 Tax=Lineus longissimus TaxID=88925 RepID=UPI002B4F1B48
MAASMIRRVASQFFRISQNSYTPARSVRKWSKADKKEYVLDKELVDKYRKTPLSSTQEQSEPEESVKISVPNDYRYVYPEFLPNPDYKIRDRLCEKLERRDMMRRRGVIDIPEFYVGSILAVTVSDPYAPGQTNRFVGLCIQRNGYGLRASFILRNVVDGEGVEILYELYNPTIQKVDVLKLEKHVDDELFYLRDAPQEHSYMPFDMDPVPFQKGAPVPVSTKKVLLNPRPWLERWERAFHLKGIELPEIKDTLLKRAENFRKPNERYDLMKQYREGVNETEQEMIYKEVHLEQLAIDNKKKEAQKAALQKAKAQSKVRRKKRAPASGMPYGLENTSTKRK